ncbi:MAG: PqiC family protein [Pseudomonadota bacterium]
MKYWSLPGLVILLLVLQGCTLLPEREPVDRAWFLLEPPAEPAPRTADVPLAVELASVRVSPTWSGKGLVYRLDEHRYESDFYNEWFLGPAEQFEELLHARWSRAASAIELVDNAARVRADGRPALRLHLLVTDLYGDLSQTEGSPDASGLGRVGLRVRVETAEHAELRHLEAERPLSRRSAQRLVAALSDATAQVFAELEDALLAMPVDAQADG